MRFPGALQRTFSACQSIIWLASWLVPAAQRPEWSRMRKAQIWHWCHFLAESGQFTREKKLELARYCWSAFPDAFWRRFDRDTFVERMQRWRSSPGGCLGAITAALLLVMLVSGIIPAARSYMFVVANHPAA